MERDLSLVWDIVFLFKQTVNKTHKLQIMRLSAAPVKILLAFIWIILATKSVRSQSGNMSDVTLPSPDSMITESDSEPTEGATPDEPEVVEDAADDETVTEDPDTATDEPVEEVVDNEATPDEPEVVEDAADDEIVTEDPDTVDPSEENTIDKLNENVAGDSATSVDEVPTDDINVADPGSNIEQNSDNPTSASEENTASDSTEAPESESIDSNIDAETVETESAALEAEEVPTESDTSIIENSSQTRVNPKSEKIVGELIEEAELKEAVDIQESKADEADLVREEALDREAIQKKVAEEEEDIVEEAAEEEAAEETAESEFVQLDRAAYETQFQEAPNDLAVLMQEEFQLNQLIGSSGIELYGSVPSVKDISRRLAQLAEQTGKKPAFINISLQENQLESFVVLPEQAQAGVAQDSRLASSELNGIDAPQADASTLRKTVKDTSREDIITTAAEFREEISDVRKLNQSQYKASAQKLYNVLIKPIEAELEANNVDVLVFSMDSGLRLLPIAALHDGEQFLVEKYAMGMVPSFGLTDTRYVSPEQSSILAMGASEFEEQTALPTMPIELETIVSDPRRGELFLNEQFTIPNFVVQNSRENPFSIIHLGTHAKFKAGDLSDSYIQFYDDKLKIPQLEQLSEELGWNSDATPIELLVLSACETALGDQEAELGFAGLAVQAGVKSALASLWYVSDLGTLALMGEFYDQLGNTLIKAEALRQTQLEMLQGNVVVNNKQVELSNGMDLALPGDFPEGTLALDHPYFWSSFTLIGNWN